MTDLWTIIGSITGLSGALVAIGGAYLHVHRRVDRVEIRLDNLKPYENMLTLHGIRFIEDLEKRMPQEASAR